MINSNIYEGELFKFRSEQISSDKPHFFLVVSLNEDTVYVVCLSSSYKTKLGFIETRNLPLETLVRIKPKEGMNELKQDSYVNCNTVIPEDEEKFRDRIAKGEIKPSGKVKASELLQVLNGIIKSPATSEFERELYQKRIARFR